jgi:hypothetical protein
VAWETYHTLGEAEIYGTVTKPKEQASGCGCAPKAETIAIVAHKTVPTKCC